MKDYSYRYVGCIISECFVVGEKTEFVIGTMLNDLESSLVV